MTIAVQQCGKCGRLNYPAREVCRDCLGERLAPMPIAGTGVLLAQSLLHASGAAFFRERLPWRVGSVLLDAGATIIVHLGDEVREIGQKVELRTELLAGEAVFFADAGKTAA